MSDRGNRVTLRTFIATYLYCLLVLRAIRSPDEAGSGVGFVPNVALLVGVVLALCSIAVLIFFIHHVPSRIHISSVIEDVGARLLIDINQRFPRFIGAPVVAGETAPVRSPFTTCRTPSAARQAATTARGRLPSPPPAPDTSR